MSGGGSGRGDGGGGGGGGSVMAVAVVGGGGSSGGGSVDGDGKVVNFSDVAPRINTDLTYMHARANRPEPNCGQPCSRSYVENLTDERSTSRSAGRNLGRQSRTTA
jgi:hypothetical protein